MSADTTPRHARSRLVGLVLALVLATPVASPAQQAGPDALSSRFRAAARRVLPAVVTVRVVGAPEVAVPVVPPGFPPGLRRRAFPAFPGPDLTTEASGVVVDAEGGWIMTTDHAVGESGAVEVVLADGRRRPVREVRRDPRSDLALLRIDPQGAGLTAAAWGDSDALDLGDWVLAVGQPFGLSGTVTSGIVGGKGRAINASQYEDLIQTDAAIHPGSSGGPLVNLEGEVVGIATARQSVAGAYQGIGFAIPSARARRVAEDLGRLGRVRRSYLGVRIEEPDPRVVAERGREAGVRVASIAAGSPAARAQLMTGDVILRVGDRPVSAPGQLQALVEFAPIDEPLSLTIRRGEEERTVEVSPAEFPGEAAFPAVEPEGPPEGPGRPADRPGEPPREEPGQDFPSLGLRLAEPSDPSAEGLLVVRVDPDGPADRGGIEAGMVVLAIGEARVARLGDAREAIEDSRDRPELIVRIRRGDRTGHRVIVREPSDDGPPRD